MQMDAEVLDQFSRVHITEMDDCLQSHIDCAKNAFKRNKEVQDQILQQNERCAQTAKLLRNCDKSHKSNFLRLCEVMEAEVAILEKLKHQYLHTKKELELRAVHMYDFAKAVYNLRDPFGMRCIPK